MSIRRLFCIMLACLILSTLLPISAAAEEIASAAHEAKMLGKFDGVWEQLDLVEKDAIESGAEPNEVTFAVYKSALRCELIDKGSFSDLDSCGFSFKVDGMACSYDYKIRNVKFSSSINRRALKDAAKGFKYGPSSMDVLLVGPYYGSDQNFSDQYAREAESIAEATGGVVTELSGEFATAMAIAEHVMYNGVVIFDSHGGAYNGTSYLCLTVSSGISSNDYSNGWAINGGSWFGIDGRYIENHITDYLPNNIFWMAICEGMKLSGNGITGEALLRAGACCVYGYSQSVTFYGDYIYEETFWNMMKDGATVAEAYNEMTSVHGDWDPAYSSPNNAAWPIVMSNLDSFPEDPDSHQTVYCDWRLFGGSLDPIGLDSYSLSATNIELYRTFSQTVKFERSPFNASDYELVWRSENPDIASVDGNKTKAEIVALSEGSTNVFCEVYVGGALFDTAVIGVNVLFFPEFNEAVNVVGGSLSFTTTTSQYPWKVTPIDDGFCVCSGNAGKGNTMSILQLVLDLREGDVLNFKMKTSCEQKYDTLGFYVNSQLNGELISGNTDWLDVSYTAPADGKYFFQWRYKKDASRDNYFDCGYVDDVELIPVSPVIGDVNGDNSVSALDALMVLRYSLSLIELTDSQIILADIDNNGRVDANDALKVLRMSLNLL